MKDSELINLTGFSIFVNKVSLESGKTQGSMHKIFCIFSEGISIFWMLIMA
jgi:hypothetical protein